MKFISFKYWINEKFTDESDPIYDMGIGMEAKLKIFLETNRDLMFTFDLDKKIFAWSGVKDPDKLNGYSVLLCFLAKHNNFELVKYVVEDKGADAKYYKSLSLRWAATTGNIDMIKYLIKHGADPNDSDQGDSLDCAKGYRQKEAVEYLKKLKNKEINEKFTEDLDPIKDLGIGIYHHKDFKTDTEAHEWIYLVALAVLNVKNYEEIVTTMKTDNRVPLIKPDLL